VREGLVWDGLDWILLVSMCCEVNSKYLLIDLLYLVTYFAPTRGPFSFMIMKLHTTSASRNLPASHLVPSETPRYAALVSTADNVS
jgi:hypothetical protein